MNKTNIIGAIAILGVLLGTIAFFRPIQQMASATFGAIPAVNAPAANSVLPNGTLLPNPSNLDYFVARVYEYVDGALGLGNGTSVPTNQQAVRSTATAATTTPCATQNPFTSTSTWISDFNVTTATSSAGNLIVAVSASPNATTTAVGTGMTIAASTQANLQSDGIASTTGLGIPVGPRQWVVWGMTAGSAVTYNYTYGGTCSTIFTTAN